MNELRLYLSYFRTQLENTEELTDKRIKYLTNFRDNLLCGIAYYQHLVPQLYNQTEAYQEQMQEELEQAVLELEELEIGVPILA